MKENRQGCLSRIFSQDFVLFSESTKSVETGEKTFSTVSGTAIFRCACLRVKKVVYLKYTTFGALLQCLKGFGQFLPDALCLLFTVGEV